MSYRIKIVQTLEGYVDIDADSLEEALEKADQLYNGEGIELPDMYDGNLLEFYPDIEPEINFNSLKEHLPEFVEGYLFNNLRIDTPQEVKTNIVSRLVNELDSFSSFQELHNFIFSCYEEEMVKYQKNVDEIQFLNSNMSLEDKIIESKKQMSQKEHPSLDSSIKQTEDKIL